MLDFRSSKTQTIPFVIDGAARIVKAVTKTTTCNDVISKLPKLEVPLAVFLSVNGTEKELPGKTRLRKVWRANSSSKQVEFVIRKSDGAKHQAMKGAPKVIEDKSRCEVQRSESSVSDHLSRDALQKVSDLAFFIRYQKKKIQNFNKTSLVESDTHEISNKDNKLRRRLTIQSSASSMDAFMAKTDLDEMARFLSFCGHVTTEKLSQAASRQRTNSGSTDDSDDVPKKKNKSSDLMSSFTNMKLSLKKKFKSNEKLCKRTTSTGTIQSTDTGYSSKGSQSDVRSTTSQTETPNKRAHTLHKRHTRLMEDTAEGPRHSTPVTAGRQRRRTSQKFECTLTQDYLGDLEDECQGKSVILERFMADQTLAAVHQTPEDVCVPVVEYPTLPNQKDRCRFMWERFCDSDDESVDSDVSDNFDCAFMDPAAVDALRQQTLRRESAFTDLRKCTSSARFSLPAFPQHTPAIDTFDYSFDCSFPRMDDSHSVDHEARNDVIDDEMFGDNNPVSDESLDSFMKTQTSGLECDVTTENVLEHNISGLDEGLGSFTSSFLDLEPEIII